MNRRQLVAALAALPFLGRLAPPAAAEPRSMIDLAERHAKTLYMDEATAAAWDAILEERRLREVQEWLTPVYDASMLDFTKVYWGTVANIPQDPELTVGEMRQRVKALRRTQRGPIVVDYAELIS